MFVDYFFFLWRYRWTASSFLLWAKCANKPVYSSPLLCFLFIFANIFIEIHELNSRSIGVLMHCAICSVLIRRNVPNSSFTHSSNWILKRGKKTSSVNPPPQLHQPTPSWSHLGPLIVPLAKLCCYETLKCCVLGQQTGMKWSYHLCQTVYMTRVLFSWIFYLSADCFWCCQYCTCCTRVFWNEKIKSLLSLNRSCGVFEVIFPMESSLEKLRICGHRWNPFYPFVPVWNHPSSFQALPRVHLLRWIFLFWCILHDGKPKIGAIKRNHHLNMRARFETFMQPVLGADSRRVFEPLTSK